MNENDFSDEEEEGSADIPLEECESGGFAILESDYKKISAKLEANEELAEFTEAYTRLFEAFYQSYQNEQDLIERTSSLQDQIKDENQEIEKLANEASVAEATIEDLRKQLIKAKLLTDDAHAREQQSQEIIENMRNQIQKLNNELELKARLGGEDEEESGAANKTKEGFEREKQRLIDEIIGLKQKLKNALSYSEELEHKNSAADLRANELNLLIEQKTSEGTKKQRQIETLEGDMNVLNDDIKKLQNEIYEHKEEIESGRKQIELIENQLRDQKTATEKANKLGEMLQLKLEKSQMELEINTIELTDLKEKHGDLVKSCKLKNEECNQLKNDMLKMTKSKDTVEKKLAAVERIKFSLEGERDKLRTTIQLMDREIHLSKKESENDRKTISNLTKEKEVISKNLMRLQTTVEGHMKLIKIQEQTRRKLEQELSSISYDLTIQKKATVKVEKERDKAMEESLDLTQQVEDAMDDINIKQKAIFDLKKIIVELETKLRQQQNLFEAVRADRNTLQKQVQEISNEIAELKSKLKISIHQSQQLKEDISSKESLLIKEETVLRKVNKEKDNLKVEVQNGLNNIHKLKHEIEELLQNEKFLTKCIAEHEKTIKKHEKSFEQIMNDRDIIGAQLVRRNDEIGLLSEKMGILETTLARGETQYDQRLEDIKLLKLEIKRLRQERNFLSKSIANMTDLKHEVFTLERELAQERLKLRALEEELQHPMNIHRWRKLEGSDPHIAELLKKIQMLQKRLINQTSESIEREKQLKEAEKLYLSLRQMLAKQPSPEIQNQLIKTQRALTLRGTKMKCLVSELNMYETQAMEYKMDVDKISKELKETKRKYFKQKKECQSHLDTKLPAIKTTEADDSVNQKFTGGGFKMM